MNFPSTINYDQAYVDFCNRNGLTVGVTPKSAKDMGLQMEMIMREEDPYLFQNLTNPDPSNLPADVKIRHQKQQYWTSDIDALQEAGFTGAAEHIKSEMAQSRQELFDKKIAESQKQQQIEQAKIKAWQDLPLGHPEKQPSPESVQRARASWGITGAPSWELNG